MRLRERLKNRTGRGAAIVAALVIIAVGFCAFDGDHCAHGIVLHLCGALLASAGAAAVLVKELTVVGTPATDPFGSVSSASLHLPDPPPKFHGCRSIAA